MQQISLIKRHGICLISGWNLFKIAEFFFFLATLHSQNIVKEIAYISSSYQSPFKSAIFLTHLKNERNKANNSCIVINKCFYFIFTISVIYTFCLSNLSYNKLIKKLKKSKSEKLFVQSLKIITSKQVTPKIK